MKPAFCAAWCLAIGWLALASAALADEEALRTDAKAKDFVGKWVGKWDETFGIILTVTEDDKTGELTALYEFEERPGSAWRKSNGAAKVTGGALLYSGIEMRLKAEDADKALALGKFARPRTAALTRSKPRADDEPAVPTTLKELLDASVEEYQFYISPEAKEPAKALVALRWSNSTRGSENGLTILYLHEGRPLAAVDRYPWAGRLVCDFEAATEEKVVARKDKKIVWQPQDPGFRFAPVPDAAPPEATAEKRLRQIRTMAAQFQCTLVAFIQDATDREELRMLPRPLYRYENTKGELIDGAVFAFVQGTDPEALLLLEAVKEGDKAHWRFGFVRKTSGALEGRHGEKVVWSARGFPTNRDPRQTHYSVTTAIPTEILRAMQP